MFKIYDGRNEFYQWDLNCKLIVEDKSVSQVHFCNRTGSCSLLRYVYEVNGLYLVDVPNVILQDNWDIKVYGYDANHTKHSATFNVVPRTRPENYVFTDEEQKMWEQLDERIDQIEENGISDEVIENAVEKYLDETGIQIDLSDYYTKAETNDAIEQAVAAIPEVDLSEYAKKSEIPSTTGLATEKYVQEQIAKIEIPETDLTDYATKQYVGEEIAKAQLSGGDVDLTGYATEKYVDDAIAAIEHPTTDLSNYYNKQEVDAKIPDTSKFITEVPAEYVTETELNQALANLPSGGGDADLSDYYTKAETEALIPTPGEGLAYEDEEAGIWSIDSEIVGEMIAATIDNAITNGEGLVFDFENHAISLDVDFINELIAASGGGGNVPSGEEVGY